MAEELSSRIAEVLEMAQKAGAREAWASIGRSREVETLVRDGEVEKVQESTSRALNLELWVDNRYASHRTTDLRPDALSRFVADAVALTRALQPDPDRRIPDPAFFAGRSSANLDLEDAGVTQIDAAQRESWCRAMDEAARRHERVISASSAAAHNESEGAAASTNGFSGTWRSTVVSLSADVTVRDEGDRRPEGSMWTVARHMGDLPNVPGIGSRALEEGLARIGSQKLPSLKGVLVVDPRAAGRLISALLGGADGRAVQQGRSVWAKKAGQKLFPEWLSLTDDPLVPRGLGSRLFDGEGIAARPIPLIAAGSLQNLYVDQTYGRKLGRPPTTGGPSNRVLGLGKRPLAAILPDMGDGIYLTSWLGGNSDATTGDFSFGIRGHRLVGGRIGEPVGEMNITGNLLDLFGQLVEVGNDPWLSSSTRVPTLVFDGVRVGGA